ncbi:MAG TPA: hypothetical protein VHA14_18240, partial [Bryobacteraceae bacterium]|nr:hypothetical protein [Bryobacteraceae bacterium]
MSIPENKPASLSRRTFMAAAGLAPAALAAANSAAPLTDVNFRKLISAADLVYDKPAPRSEEGIPIGNGRMGSLVWTTPTALHLQINRVDVYANDCTTNSFFERHNDYCGGCGYIDLDFGGEADEPFPESGFGQHLSVYDGELAIEAKGVRLRAAATPLSDVIAISVEDSRPQREPVAIVLRMLRYQTKYFGAKLEAYARDHVVNVETFSHTAASRLLIEEERIALTQEFREGGYYCKSAIAIGVSGSQSKARFVNETDVELTADSGTFTILISSAASFDTNDDVAAAAMRQLDAARARTFAAIRDETRTWWNSFWARSFLDLHSRDGNAEYVAQNYHWYLYLMAASSRGSLPPKFNGMIFNTGGDLRTWGAQHWFANLSCYYEALPAAGRFDLMDPMYEMYFGMYRASETAARQEWGSQGIYIAETTYFNGLEELPADIAPEMQDLYLLRKPWEQRSERFMDFARSKHPHSSRWNWIQNQKWVNAKNVIEDRGFGPYGAVNHNFGTTAKIAYLFWRRYEFTLDREWLESRAYPMLKGAAEFYRNHPNVKKGADGKYHIHWSNSNESVYGARDTDEDISSMLGVFGALLRASEILGADSAMRPGWREFLDHLAPLPTSDDPEALRP